MKRNTKSGTAAAAGGPGFHKGVFPMGHIRAAAGFCGACIAFYIGAGFATMQEIMQYEVSYGSRFTVVLAAAMLIYLYTNLSFATNGSRLKLQRGGEIYRHYCGKTLGAFYDYFSAFFCYMCFIVMCGGANATASQQWGLPNGAGAVILTVLVTATAVLGLNGILTTLSKVGPVVVAAILLIAGITVLRSHGGFAENLRAIDAGMIACPVVCLLPGGDRRKKQAAGGQHRYFIVPGVYCRRVRHVLRGSDQPGGADRLCGYSRPGTGGRHPSSGQPGFCADYFLRDLHGLRATAVDGSWPLGQGGDAPLPAADRSGRRDRLRKRLLPAL